MPLQYMIPVYAFLIKIGSRGIESLPEAYQLPVAEFMASQVETGE